jgi:MYXO-CTERM domain-containing protein
MPRRSAFVASSHTAPALRGGALFSGFAFCFVLLLGGSAAHAQQQCNSDADCPDGFGCDLPPSAGACDPSSGTCSSARIAPSQGECEPKALLCKADSDCPKGLTCALRSAGECDVAPAASGSAGQSAGAAPAEQPSCQEVLPSEGECVHELTPCTESSECSGGEVCTLLGTTSECSGSAGSPACAPGAQCEAPATPSEEHCTETQRFYCFPPPKGCSASEPCASGTRCVQLPDDASDHPPPGWEGLSALCLPEDWALVLEGRVALEGGSSEDTAESSSARDTAKSAQGAAGQGQDSIHVPEDDGCAIHAPGSGSGGGTWPPALALGLLALARRRRARR